MKIFNFDKRKVTDFIEYELKTIQKFKEPLNYIIANLERLGNVQVIKSLTNFNLNKVKEREGKNYDWSVFKYKNVTLVVRRYQQHLTVFTKIDKGVNKWGEKKIEYGAFTLHSDRDKFPEDKHDEMLEEYWEEPFKDLTTIFKGLIKMLTERDGGVYMVWNSACLPRPDHVELKLAFSDKTISSIDDFVFCMEEIDTIFIELFAENTVLKRIKELKVGTSFDHYKKIHSISTTLKDEYYHSVGIELIDKEDKKDSSFKDVYSLARYYIESLFKDKIYFYEGEVYFEDKDGKLKTGGVVAYKNLKGNDDAFLFQKTFPKENFIPLKKF